MKQTSKPNLNVKPLTRPTSLTTPGMSFNKA